MMGLQSILIALVLGAIVLSSGGLHFVWWNTAKRNSIELAGVIERQITDAVRREWWGRVAAAETAFGAAESLLASQTAIASREQALLVTMQSSSVMSSVVHRLPDGNGLAARREGAGADERVVVRPSDGFWQEDRDRGEAHWIAVRSDPVDQRPAVAYVGRLADGGQLGVFIALRQFSQLLGAIPVGQTGGAFVVGSDGGIIAPPDLDGKPAHPALVDVARQAGERIRQRPTSAKDIVEQIHLEHQGEGFAVALSPLNFRGWQFAVIIPEAEFLAGIDETNRRVAMGLAIFVALAGILAVLIARRALVAPIRNVVSDLALVERFDLDKIPTRTSGIAEIDQLSAAIVRMAAGLADFGKFIPTDLVRSLVADGVRAEPGGATRNITVMFADIAGFTGLSERLGIGVIEIVSRYFDLASRAVAHEHGIVDKFIGDAVMAIWGAPRDDEAQGINSCRAALAALAAIRSAGLADDEGKPLKLRIGIHSGDAIVGNIGSPSRLNYTAIGDSVNLASRLEGVNKIYGTSILISEATRALAGDAILVREVDRIAVYGRVTVVGIYELLGLAGSDAMPAWVAPYEAALKLYRERAFEDALRLLDHVLACKPDDGPALLLADRCRDGIAEPPDADWQPVFVIGSK